MPHKYTAIQDPNKREGKCEKCGALFSREDAIPTLTNKFHGKTMWVCQICARDRCGICGVEHHNNEADLVLEQIPNIAWVCQSCIDNRFRAVKKQVPTRAAFIELEETINVRT